jgi:hypothetical protein
MVNCSDQTKNLGVSKCKKRPNFLKGMITTPLNFTITAANAASASNWQDAILDDIRNRIYLWPTAVNYENISEEQQVEETPLTVMGVRKGNYRFRFHFKENLELHKRMYSHDEFTGRVLLIDIDNNIIGTSDDNGVTLKGFLLDNLLVEKMMLNDGSQASKTPVNIYMGDNTELDEKGYLLDASSFLSSLVPLTSVEITVNSASATAIDVDVISSLDGVAIVGLDAADFILLDGAGDAQSISGITDNDNGNYVLAGTGLVTGTLGLVAPKALTIQAYETESTVAVTIA